MNPANIWQYSNLKILYSYQNMSQVDDVNYGNIFIGKKISNNITIAGGGIYYGVDKIEEYNDLAQFEGFFSYNSGALLLGISNKVESFHTGLGLNFISENYSNIEDSDNAHIGVDFGLSFIDMQPIRDKRRSFLWE